MSQSKDLHNAIKVSPAINPGAIITGNGTTTGATIDRQGFKSLEFIIQTGTVTDGAWVITVYEGDASNMSDEAAVALASVIPPVAGTSTVAIAATDDNVTKKIGYVGTKRYVRIKAVQSGATTGGYLAATAVQGAPHLKPVP